MYIFIYKFFLPYFTIKLFIHKSICTIKIQKLKNQKTLLYWKINSLPIEVQIPSSTSLDD